MIKVVEVTTKKQQKAFLDFPLELYRGNPYFVPPIYSEEKQIFSPDYAYYDQSEAVYYLAMRGNKVVGRISGILHRGSNQIHRHKRVRFTRFDTINDLEVAQALFAQLENWAREKNMDTICGPLGFSNLEREGLLIEGFDQLSTFSEQYNFSYYGELIEKCGYQKEVDWIESKIYAPDEKSYNRLQRIAEKSMEKNHLTLCHFRSTKELIDRYATKIFDILDEGYADLYDTVPLTPAVRKLACKNFEAILNPDYVGVIVNEQDEIVCFGVCFPFIGEALQKSGGHLTPLTLWRLMKVLKKPRILELGLITVASKYRNMAGNAIALAGLARILKESNIEYAETNLNLEHNMNIRQMWKRFSSEEHKRRRSYVKSLT